MKMYGAQSKNSQWNITCLVLGWRNAVAWTQQHSTAVNAGPKKGNRDGRQQTVFQKYWRQRGRHSKILQNLFRRLNILCNKRLHNAPLWGIVELC